MIIFGVTLSSGEIWLLGVCGSLAAILVVFVVYRYKSFCAASAIFRSKIITELSGLYPYPIKWPDNITQFLESKFITLNAAVNEFRCYLPHRKQVAFDKAWFSFYNATGREIDNKNCQCYHHYIPSSGVEIINGKEVSHDNTKTYKEDFKRNVDNLLKFAKQK